MTLKEQIKAAIITKINEAIDDYSKWKRNNVTLRGIKSEGEPNQIYASWGNGLYTVPLGNKAMAKQYGEVHFVVNAIPKNPKIVQGINDAEIWRYKLVDDFCKANGKEYDDRFFRQNTSMEKEMLKLGYDGFVIKGREMVNYTPSNIVYFKNEQQLKNYYDTVISAGL